MGSPLSRHADKRRDLGNPGHDCLRPGVNRDADCTPLPLHRQRAGFNGLSADSAASANDNRRAIAHEALCDGDYALRLVGV